jgi:hypothetical protein
MDRAARSILVFGAYLIVVGLALVLAPDLVFAPVGIAPSTEPWPRVLGVVVAILGTYYLVAARERLVPIIALSVRARGVAVVAFAGLVMAGWAPPALLVFGAIDAAGALWTWWALRRAAS